jgi:hypothetical protein
MQILKDSKMDTHLPGLTYSEPLDDGCRELQSKVRWVRTVSKKLHWKKSL